MMKKTIFVLKKMSLHPLSGFTLSECLLSLYILTIICLLFSATLTTARTVIDRLKNTQEKEWNIFLIQLEQELNDTRYLFTDKNKFVFKENNSEKELWIEWKLQKIVKVKNGGYQPLLMKVEEAIFSEEKEHIELTVIFEDKRQSFARWKISREKAYE